MLHEHQTFIHPETQTGEQFLINATAEQFNMLTSHSKRKGIKTFDGLGNSIPSNNKFPVFVNNKEDVMSLRQAVIK